MAISFDASTGPASTTGTSLTFSHTCTGSNLILFVACMNDSVTDTISGVTYNSVAMTLVTNVQVPVDLRYVYLFYLVNPSTGANDVVVSSTTSEFMRATAASYAGAAQSTPIDASNTETGIGETSHAFDVTTVTDNCWTIISVRADGGSISAGSGTTLRGTGTFHNLLDSNAAITPAGATTLNVNFGSSNNGGVIAAFKPFVASATTRRNRMLTGIGN